MNNQTSIDHQLFCLLNLVLHYKNIQSNYFKSKNARNLKHLKAIEMQMYKRAEYINNLYFENEMNIELKRLIDSEDWNRLTPDSLK